ncbi:MAG: T9SS type A sorting domain-containing protein [Dysgonomonas sp.]
MSENEKSYVYYNPVTQRIFLKSEETVESVYIYNMSGKLLYGQDLQAKGEINVDAQFVNNGVYLVRWITESGVRTAKLIK